MSLFTVEQLELIRRLRATGITPDNVIEAFRTLDKIESDLDAARVQSQALAALIAPKLEPQERQERQERRSVEERPQAEERPVVVAAPQPVQAECQSPILLQHLRAQPPVPLTISSSPVPVASVSSPSPLALALHSVTLPSTANSESSTPLIPLASFTSQLESSGARPIRSQRTPMKEITTLDDPRELDEFMVQGEEGCIADMKHFITQYSLRQTTVAMMTGVSQPYISKLLNGNHRELSLRCRKNIYCWYLNCRRHPEKLSAFLNDPATRLETNGDGELVPQRRERYVFRPILIRMLESFFAQTPFPDLNRRIEIATACNHALQLDKKGVGLMPKEVVSPQVVANWFANKRKELRRRSNEEQQMKEAGGSQPATPLDGGAPSCSDETGSTPSPSPEGESSQSSFVDVAALAQRLGFGVDMTQLFPWLPTPVSLPSDDAKPLPAPQPVSHLAAQLMQPSTPPAAADERSLQQQLQQTMLNQLAFQGLLPAGMQTAE